jgi:hypothetical protein
VARLSSLELNQAFVAALGDRVLHVDDLHARVLTLELAPPLPRLVRAYLFNSTNPPGGRSTPEHKIQLMVPAQGREDRGNFDFSGDRAVVLAGKVEDEDAWVVWDASLHRDFKFSGNAQVRTATVNTALEMGALATQERRLRLGTETVIAAPSAMLPDALRLRFPAAAHGVPAIPVPPAPPPAPAPPHGGRAYAPPPRGERPDEPKARVFEVDPDLVDRGTTAHKDVQDALADALRSHGLEPLSPQPGDPQFDVAWLQDGVACIAEVKSLTDANEERQLRLGLGQVLSYVHVLDWPHATAVQAVLAVERQPTADYWTTLCAEHDVVLTWPEAYEDLFINEP